MSPYAIEEIKRQRNRALDRVAELEADLASARQMCSDQKDRIIELADMLSRATMPLPGVIDEPS